MIIGLSVVANAHWSLTRSTIIGPAVFANACPSVITDKCVDSLLQIWYQPHSQAAWERENENMTSFAGMAIITRPLHDNVK